MASIVVYPDSFPVEAVQTLVRSIRTPGAVPISEALHAGWNVIGFGLGQILPMPQSPFPHPRLCNAPAAEVVALTAEEVATKLESVLSEGHPAHVSGAAPAFALDWKQLIQSLLPILINWLTRL